MQHVCGMHIMQNLIRLLPIMLNHADTLGLKTFAFISTRNDEPFQCVFMYCTIYKECIPT